MKSSPIRRVSVKRAARLTLRWNTTFAALSAEAARAIVARHVAVKRRNPKRRASAFVRCYHSAERVAFVQTLPCAASGQFGTVTNRIENAHVIDDGTKGISRKSGYRCIAPMLPEVHRMRHREPERFRALYPNFDAERAADETEAAWQVYASARGIAP